MSPPPSRYRFAEFTLSPARRSLRRAGREVPLIPRYLDLLILLVERRAVALPRREMLDRVWADVVVSDGALSQAVRTLRRTLGEDDHIRTVSRHGYQFVCPVLEEEDEDDHTPLPQRPRAEAEPGDQIADALARLLDGSVGDEVRRDAAEELHALGTREALRRLAAAARRRRARAGAGVGQPARQPVGRGRRGPGAAPRADGRTRGVDGARLAAPATRAAPRRRAVGPGLGRRGDRGCSRRASRRAAHGRARRIGRALAARRSRTRGCGRGRGRRRRCRLRPRRGGGDRPLATRRRARRPRRARRGRRRVPLAPPRAWPPRRALRPRAPGDRRRPRGPGARRRGRPRLRPRHAADEGRRRRAARPGAPRRRRRDRDRLRGRSRPSCRRPAAGSARRVSTPSSAASPPPASASTRSGARSVRTASARAPGRPSGSGRGSSSAPASPPAWPVAPALAQRTTEVSTTPERSLTAPSCLGGCPGRALRHESPVRGARRGHGRILRSVPAVARARDVGRADRLRRGSRTRAGPLGRGGRGRGPHGAGRAIPGPGRPAGRAG